MQPTPQNNQLMSKHRVLSLKPQLRLEWRGQDGQSETEQPDHSASLGDSITSSTRMRFSAHTACKFVDSRCISFTEGDQRRWSGTRRRRRSARESGRCRLLEGKATDDRIGPLSYEAAFFFRRAATDSAGDRMEFASTTNGTMTISCAACLTGSSAAKAASIIVSTSCRIMTTVNGS